MKKALCLLLSCLMIAGLFSGCGKTDEPAVSTQPPVSTESPEEARSLKIMILGSSRSVNTFQLLYEAFKDQMPEQELVLGIMYYSGCSMSMHTNFIKANQSVYDFYCNEDGRWNIQKGVNMDTGLLARAWDVILLQAGNGDLENNMNEPCRTFLKEYVDSKVKHPHTLWWHSTWTNSTDPILYDPAKTNLKPENIDQYKQLTDGIDAAKAYVMDDPMFAGHITSGTPMMYALKVLEVPETDLYRDHTHLSDFGCLLVAFAWYAQYTGKPVTQINLETIPAHLRHARFQDQGPLVVTEEMKEIIIQTVNYTLENPWSVPVKE